MSLKRESCRNFNGKEVKEADILKIIEIARLAPSACNAQPWFFYIVTNQELKNKVAEQMQTFNQKAGAFIVIIEEKPCFPVKCINTFKLQDYTKIDLGIVASYICLAATKQEIASCMIGLFHEEKIKKILSIDLKRRIRLIISLGYCDSKKPRKKQRKDIEEIYQLYN